MVPTAGQRPTLSVREAAPHLGCSDATLFRAIAEDRSPVAFIKCGARISIVTADLRRVLQLDPPAATNGEEERA
jgi:hypothetical protein